MAGTGTVETLASEDEGENPIEKMRGSVLVPKSPGLYKIQGTTVEGIMGGVFHQYVRFLPSTFLSIEC